MTPGADAVALERAMECAEQDLVVASANGPLCRVEGDVQGVKYFEGRWAALRALRGRIDQCDADIAAAHAALNERSGVAWVSYQRGMIDALNEFRTSLRATTP